MKFLFVFCIIYVSVARATGTVEDVHNAIEKVMQDGKIPGVSAAIIKGGKKQSGS